MKKIILTALLFFGFIQSREAYVAPSQNYSFIIHMWNAIKGGCRPSTTSIEKPYIKTSLIETKNQALHRAVPCHPHLLSQPTSFMSIIAQISRLDRNLERKFAFIDACTLKLSDKKSSSEKICSKNTNFYIQYIRHSDGTKKIRYL